MQANDLLNTGSNPAYLLFSILSYCTQPAVLRDIQPLEVGNCGETLAHCFCPLPARLLFYSQRFAAFLICIHQVGTLLQRVRPVPSLLPTFSLANASRSKTTDSVVQTRYINCSNQSLPSPPFAVKSLCIALKLNGKMEQVPCACAATEERLRSIIRNGQANQHWNVAA